jgi:cytochrome c-type biogenesis protein CcsB
MLDGEALARWSNVFVDSALLVYAGALAAFAVDLSARGRPGRPAAGVTRTARVAVPVGAVPEAGAGSAAGTYRSDTSGPAASGPDTHGPAGSGPAASGPVGGGSRAGGIAVALTWLAFAVHLAGVVARGASVQRVPWANMYEFAITGSLVVTGVFLAALFRRDLRFLGSFVVGPVLLVLAVAVTAFYTEASQLVPALDSYWLLIHVSVAFVAAALFTLGFSTAVLQVVQESRERLRAAGGTPRAGRFMDTVPSSAELERLSYRLHVVGFPLWTFTVIVGAIWADSAWGRYWGWDPKETWSFVVWVGYAAYLHARLTRGWDGRRGAVLAFVAFGALVFNFVGVNLLFSGWHSYSGVG